MCLLLVVVLQGCDTFTFSPKVMVEMFSVSWTLKAAAEFEAAAACNQ